MPAEAAAWEPKGYFMSPQNRNMARLISPSHNLNQTTHQSPSNNVSSTMLWLKGGVTATSASIQAVAQESNSFKATRNGQFE